MKRKLQPRISESVKAIYHKLVVDEASPTTREKHLEVTRDEAAYLLSARAGRVIRPEYIKQLTRGEKPRLLPARLVGNSYMYTVDSLLKVRFTRGHKEERKEDAA